eukprot:766290-Amorphochlora_amoeboformis.AAC.2
MSKQADVKSQLDARALASAASGRLYLEVFATSRARLLTVDALRSYGEQERALTIIFNRGDD